MRTIMLLIMFFLLGAFFIISNENLHIGNKEEFSLFGNLYYSWLSGLFDNFNSISGYVINSRWLPIENSTERVIVLE